MPRSKIPNLDFRHRNFKKPNKDALKAANPVLAGGFPQSADPTMALLLSTLLFSFHCVGAHAKISEGTKVQAPKSGDINKGKTQPQPHELIHGLTAEAGMQYTLKKTPQLSTNDWSNGAPWAKKRTMNTEELF